ncbi:amidohydrolase [Glaciihabitans arcticus]|uniref:amidohydrolase n=1 Tax=Glaciihabitans arcticus TaxID=2668039 RepID=UPI001F02D028|nr:amidohydrolase [Glaciihabitans arcticus]
MQLTNVVSAGRPVDLTIEDSIITAIEPSSGTGEYFVSPGLWDNHVHFSQWALVQQRLDVSAATSARQAVDMVRAGLERSDIASPFIAFGFRDGLWPDAPTVELLDEVSVSHPIVLVSGDLHAVWLNTPALAQYGHAGHPTGLLREDPAFEVTRRIDTVDPLLLDRWVDAAARHAASRGVVGVTELEMDWNLDTWQRRIDGGIDSLRVEFGIYTPHLDRAVELGMRSGQRINDLLTVGYYKVLTDGSLNTRTAYCFDDYPGTPGEHGMLTMPTDQLMPHLRKAVAAGIVPTVHAIGDHAVSLVLDAFEKLGSGGRMEHAQLVGQADFARFAALGVIASVQPDHMLDDRDVADRYWAGRTDRTFAFRSLLDAGAQLALGSDAPVSPLDPWVTAAAAVGRTRGGREPWHPEQRISTAEALAASTRNTVEVGQVADLILTESDPLLADDAQLREFTVAATLLGGRLTHDAR